MKRWIWLLALPYAVVASTDNYGPHQCMAVDKKEISKIDRHYMKANCKPMPEYDVTNYHIPNTDFGCGVTQREEKNKCDWMFDMAEVLNLGHIMRAKPPWSADCFESGDCTMSSYSLEYPKKQETK